MKKSYLLIIFIIFLVGCSEDENEKDIKEIDLTGGEWVATAGFDGEEIGGEAHCYPIDEGIRFNDDHTAYQKASGESYEYRIRKKDSGYVIDFRRLNNGFLYSYSITGISDDEIGLEGTGDFQKAETCYLERK